MIRPHCCQKTKCLMPVVGLVPCLGLPAGADGSNAGDGIWQPTSHLQRCLKAECLMQLLSLPARNDGHGVGDDI